MIVTLDREPATTTGLIRNKAGGYYRDAITGERLRSVTTILSQGVPKEALIFWAGNLVAQTAMENLEYLLEAAEGTDAERTEAYNWLRRAHTRKKEDRADVGSAVHNLIESEILGEPVPAQLLEDPEMAPYVAQFRAFVRDFKVVFEASEMVVANYTHGVAGTLDHMFRSPYICGGDLLMGDTKTGGEIDVRGVYAEAGLQMAAYRHAEFGWLRDGSRIPMPATRGGVVLHLRPEGYRVVPVQCDDAMFEVFLHAKRVAEFTSQLSKGVVKAPLHPGDGHTLDTEGGCRHCPYAATPGEQESPLPADQRASAPAPKTATSPENPWGDA